LRTPDHRPYYAMFHVKQGDTSTSGPPALLPHWANPRCCSFEDAAPPSSMPRPITHGATQSHPLLPPTHGRPHARPQHGESRDNAVFARHHRSSSRTGDTTEVDPSAISKRSSEGTIASDRHHRRLVPAIVVTACQGSLHQHAGSYNEPSPPGGGRFCSMFHVKRAQRPRHSQGNGLPPAVRGLRSLGKGHRQ
jgi:hypothetical protein